MKFIFVKKAVWGLENPQNEEERTQEILYYHHVTIEKGTDGEIKVFKQGRAPTRARGSSWSWSWSRWFADPVWRDRQ